MRSSAEQQVKESTMTIERKACIRLRPIRRVAGQAPRAATMAGWTFDCRFPALRAMAQTPSSCSPPVGRPALKGAMSLAARQMRVTLPPETAIDAEVDLCSSDGEYFLQARLNIRLPGLDRETAQAMVDAAHQTCPYSKATRGNIDVAFNVVTK